MQCKDKERGREGKGVKEGVLSRGSWWQRSEGFVHPWILVAEQQGVWFVPFRTSSASPTAWKGHCCTPSIVAASLPDTKGTRGEQTGELSTQCWCTRCDTRMDGWMHAQNEWNGACVPGEGLRDGHLGGAAPGEELRLEDDVPHHLFWGGGGGFGVVPVVEWWWWRGVI